MATRSRIAIEKENGTVESIYCHWDGYPENNGRILIENYKDHEKVQALIDLGDISSLAPNVEADPHTRHTFNDPVDGVVVAYGRDRGETGVEKKSHSSVPNFFDGDIDKKIVKKVCELYLLFLIVVTLLYHPPTDKMIPFLSNVTTFGGMLLIYNSI